MPIAFQSKVLGIEWREFDEVGEIMIVCERHGIMERRGNTEDALYMRRRPNAVSVKERLGDDSWMNANMNAILDLFPETWTHAQNINFFDLGIQMREIGLNWADHAEMHKVIEFLELHGVVQRELLTIRANPSMRRIEA